MLCFEKSEYAESIYYADLFRISDKIWMIMGYGKSNAAKIASGNIRTNDIGRDCIAIRNHNGVLEGRFDSGAIGQHATNGLYDFHKIDYLVYCLSPEDTEVVYRTKERSIQNCSLEVMKHLCVIYPYSAFSAQAVFSCEELAYLNDPDRRANKFYEVVKSCNFQSIGLVPFMETVEEKALLYNEVKGRFSGSY